MTVNDYILQKFQTFGVNLSEADLFDICLNAKISGGGEMNEDCHGRHVWGCYSLIDCQRKYFLQVPCDEVFNFQIKRLHYLFLIEVNNLAVIEAKDAGLTVLQPASALVKLHRKIY